MTVQMKLGERPEFKAHLIRYIHMLDQILSFVAVNGKKDSYQWLKYYGLLVKSSPPSVSVNKVLLGHSDT